MDIELAAAVAEVARDQRLGLALVFVAPRV